MHLHGASLICGNGFLFDNQTRGASTLRKIQMERGGGGEKKETDKLSDKAGRDTAGRHTQTYFRYFSAPSIQEHLKEKAGRHVAFVVPKVRLARQQYERFLAYLPEFKPYLKCGETSGSQSSKQPLSDVLQT